MQSLLREPLLHFVFLGLIIYGLISAFTPAGSNLDERTIVVTPNALANFLQNRDQVFDSPGYLKIVANMEPTQKARVVDQYAEQEVLFREASKLGLEQNDQVLRRRVIQKLKYFLEGLASAESAPSPQQLTDYFESHKQDYLVSASTSFTHVFYKTNESDRAEASVRAKLALSRVGNEDVSHQELNGDHFPYHRNYVAKSASQVSRHFGKHFAEQIFELAVDPTRWQGPISSAYGEHLIKISRQSAAHTPEMENISAQLKRDLERANYAQALQAQIDQLVAQYDIVVSP